MSADLHDPKRGFRSKPPNTADLEEDLDEGSPQWARGVRADLRALALDVRTGFRTQTIGVAVIVLTAMCLNAALVLGALHFNANQDGVSLSTSAKK